MKKNHLLFLVILIEGYVVLASELLAIRQLIPFVGSGTETISIVISAVLLPLAFGYHYGGRAFRRSYERTSQKARAIKSIRMLLLRNIMVSLSIFAVGLSYICMELFFGLLSLAGIHNHLLHTSLYVALFIVTPVFLLGQTVPLVSNYFSRRKLSEITGQMLFFSTAGSFLGSVFSTIVLMMTIGVHNTVLVTLGLLVVLVVLLSKRWYAYEVWFSLFVFGLAVLFNSNATMRSLNIVSNNAYNLISIQKVPREEATIFNVNRSYSSKISKDREHMFGYWKYVEDNVLGGLQDENKPPRDVLVVGAGGFTLGLDDTHNQYTYVDIDKDLKRVAEQHFLGQPLSANKTFVAASAREFIRHSTKQYDVIIIDTFTNVISIPMETTTVEFLQDAKALLKENGVLAVNVVTYPDFRDRFSVRYDNTFSHVFPVHTRQVIEPMTPWREAKDTKEEHALLSNVMYVYVHRPLVNDSEIYTDNKNTYSLDRK